ncbi:DUF4062 domain-containing protein [Lentzea sp. NPDC059081]|uniref:DUF4062 domain-containing protein n=1 Tax=Lentzea sp. NPDC059081 TaxID=3346719 RepID=UPI00367DA297
MARVYVSSTFSDLADYREAVLRALKRLDHEVVAMEHYVAEDALPVDRCLADVRSADLYVVVMAWRYGFIPPGHSESITELEYRAAVDADIPVLAFVLSEDHSWAPKLMELEKIDRVRQFRSELMESRVVGVFGSKDDLARQVAEGIQKWERNDSVVDSNVDWAPYRRAVVEKYRYVRLSVIAGAQHDRLARIPLLDVFTPQQLRAGRPDYDLPEEDGEGGPAPSEDSVVVLGREQKQVVLGGPGSGKSTLFQASLLAISDGASDASRVPVELRDLPLVLLVELREYVLRGSPDFLTYLIASISENFGLLVDGTQLVEALDDGAVVFFDGLDEVFDPAARSRVTDQFRAFTLMHPDARVVVSSRIVGYDETELGLAGFEHYTLLDFGIREIREFVPKWYEHYSFDNDERDAAGLVHRIADNPRLLELAGNPLLLTMMAVLYKHQDLPEKRWQLYDRCTAVLLEDWDVKRKKIDSKELLPLDFRIGGEQKAEILQSIAMTMLSSRRDEGHELNAIAYAPLRDIIGAYLEKQYAKPPGEARAIAVEILNHLRERTFVLAETGDGVFGFVHRTFMEYFVAKHVLSEFNQRRADYEWLKTEVFRLNWSDDRWREPLLLLSAMLSGQGSPIREIVHSLSSFADVRALAFAARCLAEAGSVAPADQNWASELAHRLVIYVEFVSPKADYYSEYLSEIVSALEALSVCIPISEFTRRDIKKYRASSTLGERIVGFRLELAIASRAERRQAALAGLSDRDEAVRRAAIASLERESGDEVLYETFLSRLYKEGNSRVREPLIAALDRGWPRRRDVLHAIALRAERETSMKHARWIASHLAVAWAGDPQAREVVFGLAKHDFGAEDLILLRHVIPSSLVRGWKDGHDTVPYLLDQLRGLGPAGARSAAIRACAALDLQRTFDWSWQNSSSSQDIAEIADAVFPSETLRRLLTDFEERHPDQEFRQVAHRLLLDAFELPDTVKSLHLVRSEDTFG